MAIPIKLNTHNYNLWKPICEEFLGISQLGGYLDGSIEVPPEVIFSDNGSSTTNPNFILWRQRDQTAYTLILNSISTSIREQCVDIPTSYRFWLQLKKICLETSNIHINKLQSHLQHLKKNDSSSMEDYLHSINLLVDSLTAAGVIFDISDVVRHILKGLPASYGAFVNNVSGDISPEILHNLLLDEENKIHGTAINLSSQEEPDQEVKVCKMRITTLFWLAAYSLNSMLLTMVALFTCMALFNRNYNTVRFEVLSSIGVVVFNSILVFGVWRLMQWCRPEKVRNESELQKNEREKKKKKRAALLTTYKQVIDFILSVAASLVGTLYQKTCNGVWHKLLVGWFVGLGIIGSSSLGYGQEQGLPECFSAFTSSFIPVVLYFITERSWLNVVIGGTIYITIAIALVVYFRVKLKKGWECRCILGLFAYACILGFASWLTYEHRDKLTRKLPKKC